MTIFARRRLQQMLNELASALTDEKGRDLLKRLNHEKDVGQALPAEMELALLWAIKCLGDLEVEPEWWADSRRPDAVTEALVPGRTASIEIAALTDNAISGEQAMHSIAVQISTVANKTIKGVGDHLYFRFQETSGYLGGRYTRYRLAPQGFQLTKEMETQVRNWVHSGQSRETRLRLTGSGLDVEIEHTGHKQVRYHNLFSSMPPETHSLEDNPLYDLMHRKRGQLKAASPGTLRMIFLADVGSTLLRRVGRSGERDHTARYVSGSEIIAHFLRIYEKDVDAVVTFSPLKESSRFLGGDPLGRKPQRWTVHFFGSPALPTPPEKLGKLAALLPAPHYEGYQARSLFRQGSFSPKHRGQYLGMTIHGRAGDDAHEVEFPARTLLDLLAGRISADMFTRWVCGNGSNIFKHWLDKGLTISGASIAPRDIDEDDDHLILRFSDDPAARPFTLPDDGSQVQ